LLKVNVNQRAKKQNKEKVEKKSYENLDWQKVILSIAYNNQKQWPNCLQVLSYHQVCASKKIN
jgi:hypothetical protein